MESGLGFQIPEPTSAVLELDRGEILVVDDDEGNRDLLGRRLRRYGYSVSAAATGVRALKLAALRKFDLILLDLVMPGLDGFQVLARVKADPPLKEIRVVMLSALDQETAIARCIEMGAEDYISKPFAPDSSCLLSSFSSIEPVGAVKPALSRIRFPWARGFPHSVTNAIKLTSPSPAT